MQRNELLDNNCHRPDLVQDSLRKKFMTVREHNNKSIICASHTNTNVSIKTGLICKGDILCIMVQLQNVNPGIVDGFISNHDKILKWNCVCYLV